MSDVVDTETVYVDPAVDGFVTASISTLTRVPGRRPLAAEQPARRRLPRHIAEPHILARRHSVTCDPATVDRSVPAGNAIVI